MKKIYYSLLLVFVASTLIGQKTTYKEIKTIKKQIDARSGGKFLISGERSYIKVKTWDKNYIDAKIDIIAKHTSKDQASADLEKISIVLEKNGSKVIYSNALRIKSPADKPISNLSIIAVFYIPEMMDLDVSNSFGEIDASGKYSKFEVRSEFSPIILSSFNGKSDVKSKYGDITIEDYTGKLSLNADRSNISMEEAVGEINVKAKYGDVEIYFPRKKSVFDVEAFYSPVSLYLGEDHKYPLALTCKECSITEMGETIPIDISKDEDNVHGEVNTKLDGKQTSKVFSKLEDIKVYPYTNKTKNK